MKTVSVLLVCASTAVALSACTPSPDEARQKLGKENVPLDGNSLIAKTKSDKTEETAKLLVIAGADPNAVQANGMTVLMSAVFNDQSDVARLLIEKGAKLETSAQGFNALSLAVEKNNRDMVKLLLQAGADPKTRPVGGMSALEKAQQLGNTAMIELLEKSK